MEIALIPSMQSIRSEPICGRGNVNKYHNTCNLNPHLFSGDNELKVLKEGERDEKLIWFHLL